MARSDLVTMQAMINSHPDRPLLTHLNADTSWLISLPHPNKVVNSRDRKYYHLLVDPWLAGTNIVVSTWLISLTHAVTPAYTSIEEVRQLVTNIEGATSSTDDGEPDCVVVTHFERDHCDEHTLRQLHPSTMVISTVPGIARIRSFKHFDESAFSTIPTLTLKSPEDLWRDSSLTTSYNSNIPSWLKVGQLPSHGNYPHFHWATIIAWSPTHTALGQSDSMAETFIYSPHGIRSERLEDTSWATDPVKGSLLCNMHGFSPAWAPVPINLGVQNGYMLSKMLKPRYWVPTHDEVLTYTGFLGWLQTKVQKTLQDVVRLNEEGTIEEELKKAGITIRELGNGETFCLV